MDLNKLSYDVIGSALKVHSALGPGLLESAYHSCLFYQLKEDNFQCEEFVPVQLKYKALRIHRAYELDIILENSLILELKAVEAITDIHKAQLLTYLKLTNIKMGLILNFNTVSLCEHGIKRVLNGYNIETKKQD